MLLAALFAAALPATAEIYRCKTAGSVSYQEQPCDAASQGGAVAIPTEFPDYIEPRNRLAARDERAAREAQAQAEREQAQAAQAAWYPVFVVLLARVRPLARIHPLPPFPPHSQPLMR